MSEMQFIIPDDPAPRWSNAEKTTVDCRIIFPHLGEEPVDFTAAKLDPGWEHSEKIFDILVSGDLGIEIGDYVAPPAPVPAEVSDRQFAREARERGLITQSEAIGFVARGETPAVLAEVIGEIEDARTREDYELFLAGESTIPRAHPLVDLVRSSLGWSEGQMDDFFRAAGAAA
jgi:hypothetical protein